MMFHGEIEQEVVGPPKTFGQSGFHTGQPADGQSPSSRLDFLKNLNLCNLIGKYFKAIKV